MGSGVQALARAVGQHARSFENAIGNCQPAALRGGEFSLLLTRSDRRRKASRKVRTLDLPANPRGSARLTEFTHPPGSHFASGQSWPQGGNDDYETTKRLRRGPLYSPPVAGSGSCLKMNRRSPWAVECNPGRARRTAATSLAGRRPGSGSLLQAGRRSQGSRRCCSAPAQP
jgi:hypothetical protein